MIAASVLSLPAAVWGTPSSDLTLRGFDPHIVAFQPSSAIVRDPLAFISSGSGLPCPCWPGERVTVLGRFGPILSGSDVRLRIAGQVIMPEATDPTQIVFTLPYNLPPGSYPVEVYEDDRLLGSDYLSIAPVETPELKISGEQMRLLSRSGHNAAIHLVTTPLPFIAEITLQVERHSGNADPAWLLLWDPRSGASFGFALRASGAVEVVAADGMHQESVYLPLASWQAGRPLRLRIARDKDGSVAASLPDIDGAFVHLGQADLPLLSRAYRISLSLVSLPRDGVVEMTASNFRIVLPHRSSTTTRTTIRGGYIAAIVSAILAAGLGLSLTRLHRTRAGARGHKKSSGRQPATQVSPSLLKISIAGAIVSLPAVAIAWGFLSWRGSHPFDMSAQAIWSYLLATKPLGDIYHLSQIAPVTAPWNGTPYHEAVFPYGIAMAYWFRTIAAVLTALPGGVDPASTVTAVVIKAGNAIAAVGCGALAAAVVRTLSPGSRISPLAAAALVAASPAAIADGAIWGETEHVVLLPLLFSLLCVLHGRMQPGWAALAVAALTKQTVLPVVLLLAILYMWKQPLAMTLKGVGTAVATVLLLALPMNIHGYPPAIVIQPLWSTTALHAGYGIERAFQMVGLDLPNLWSLVTRAIAGVEGSQRLAYPDFVPLLGPVSAHEAGLAFALILSAAVMLMALSRADRDRTVWLVAAAALWTGGLFFMTGSLSRYLVFPASLGAIAAASRPSIARAGAATILTGVAAVAIYSSMAVALAHAPHMGPTLAPGNNRLSAALVAFFRSDHGIDALAALLAVATALLLIDLALSRRCQPAVVPPGAGEERGSPARKLAQGLPPGFSTIPDGHQQS